VFELSINVPEQYPLVPPTVRYRTKVFHPNVHFKVGWRRRAVRCGLGCGLAGSGGRQLLLSAPDLPLHCTTRTQPQILP